MQLVLSKNRIIAHGENFLAMGGVVVNTETGDKYDNATIAECDGGCPSDINEVGYEYHAGVFVPCAPYGKGNNNGYFMEVCKGCATPKNSGIPIKEGITLENLSPDVNAASLGGANIDLLWENTSTNAAFKTQKVALPLEGYDFLLIEHTTTKSASGSYRVFSQTLISATSPNVLSGHVWSESTRTYPEKYTFRLVSFSDTEVNFRNAATITPDGTVSNEVNTVCIPTKIYGVKL